MKNLRLFAGFTASLVLAASLMTSCKKGDQGLPGATGATGATGAAGTAGAPGNAILSGEGAPSASIGNVGDFYLQLDSPALFGPKTSSGWGSPIGLKGADGQNGATGANGADGNSGALVDTFHIATADWTTSGYAYTETMPSGSYTYPTQIYTRYSEQITQDILDNGMVLVYYTPNYDFNPDQWLPLPNSYVAYYTEPILNNPQRLLNYNWTYETKPNLVTLQFYLTKTSSDDQNAPDVSLIQLPYAKFKVVVVPGTITRQVTAIINRKISATGHISAN